MNFEILDSNSEETVEAFSLQYSRLLKENKKGG